ncbi:hypothetical protein GGTG_05701 [Gaeumannomyces tritici R3-111a-1]|uniref:Uncharacterized protein n=1 Tax=Gaeumannomyces tritici (strain R3-111a-1) TaxID=644352 RepID=J3NWN9_GAET3|nr:hypothetical protein GGTG_05701 [Gaeumannomyces tritici R3-111a-1]EJT75771.1 hypothetical protein GGTG_05701 [Gaeumannomyces tritici R3-111a-1]
MPLAFVVFGVRNVLTAAKPSRWRLADDWVFAPCPPNKLRRFSSLAEAATMGGGAFSTAKSEATTSAMVPCMEVLSVGVSIIGTRQILR